MKVSVVTGGSSGIGAALARQLAARGVRCVLVARGRERLERVAAELGAEAEVCDVQDRAAVDALVRRVRERHPAIHLLVNNAGVPGRRGFLELEPERIEEIVRINYLGGVWCLRAFLPLLEAGRPAHVVNVASVHGLVASVHKAPYVAAKFGLVGMSRVAALEYAAAGSRASGGVTVNCVCPGWTETAIIQPQIDARAQALGVSREDAVRELLREKQPSLRTSLPQEIARVVAWLCEPAAHNLTGAAIPVDGGWTAQ